MKGKELVRAQINTPIFYMVSNIFFVLAFTGIILLTIFKNVGYGQTFSWAYLSLAALGGVAVVSLLFFGFSALPAWNKKVESTVVFCLLLLFFIAQVYVGYTTSQLGADIKKLNEVFIFAKNYALMGTVPDDYFVYSGAGTGLYVILANLFAVLKYFGVSNFMLPAAIINSLGITYAVYMLHDIIKMLFGGKKAVQVVILSVMLPPLWMHVPLISVETMVLPFMGLMIHTWLKCRSAWRSGKYSETIVYFCILSIVTGFGMFIRTSMIVLWVAFVIDLLFLLCGKGRLLVLFAGAAVLAGFVIGMNWTIRQSTTLPLYKADNVLPPTYGIMTGLRGIGGKNTTLYNQVIAQPTTQEKENFIESEIKNRVAELGIGGVILNGINKLAYNFSDPTFGAAYTFSGWDNPGGIVYNATSVDGTLFTIGFMVSFGMLIALEVWAIVSAIRAVLTRNECFSFLRLAMLGFLLTAMLWQTDPINNLILLIPLALLTIEGAPISKKAKQGVPKDIYALQAEVKQKIIEEIESSFYTDLISEEEEEHIVEFEIENFFSEDIPYEEIALPLEQGDNRHHINNPPIQEENFLNEQLLPKDNLPIE